jgi:hypothetical protein
MALFSLRCAILIKAAARWLVRMEEGAKGSDIAWTKGLQIDPLAGLRVFKNQRTASVQFEEEGMVSADATGIAGSSQASQDAADEATLSGGDHMNDLVLAVRVCLVDHDGAVIAVFEFELPRAQDLDR